MRQTIEVDMNITLQSIENEDIPNLLKYISDAAVFANTLVIPNPYGQAEAEAYINFNRQFELENKMQCNWGIHYRDFGFIGGIGLLFDDGIISHKSKFGYWIGQPFRSQGIMSKVVTTFTEHVMAVYNLIRLEACVFSDNRASMRVLEKAGFVYEGESRKYYKKGDQILDVLRYAMIL